MERDFESYGAPLENVMEFKYMGQVITEVNDDWPTVVGKLQRVRKSWEVVADFGPGGGGSEGVRTFFQGGDIGSVVVRGGYVGNNPQYGAGSE